MELFDNIVEQKPEEDYNDFVNRRRTNKKSIRTKVTTLKDDGEIVSEILGTNGASSDEFDLSSADGSKDSNEEQKVEVKSSLNATDDNTNNTNTTTETKQIENDKIKKDDAKVKSNMGDENKTVFGMKPVYGYTCIAVITLVGIAATVKILKNNKLNKLKLN